MPSSARDRTRGRADTLLLFSALLVTGLVATGVTLMFTGEPGNGGEPAGGVDRGAADRTSDDGSAATGRDVDRTGATTPARRSHVNRGTGNDQPTRRETAAVAKTERPTRDQPDARSSSVFGDRSQKIVRSKPIKGREGLDGAGSSVDAPHAGRSRVARSADQMKRDLAEKAAQSGRVGTVAARTPGATVAARTGTSPDGRPTFNGINTSRAGNTAAGNTAAGKTAGNRALDGTAIPANGTTGNDGAFAADADNTPRPGSQNPSGSEEDLIEDFDPPGYDEDPDNPTEPGVEEEPEPEPEEEEPEVDVNGSAYLLVPAEVEVGTTIQVPLMIDAGLYLAAYGLELAWDNSVLSIDSVGAGSGGFDPPFVVNLENDKGQLRFNGISVTPVASGKIPVATLTITVLDRPQSGRAQIRPMSGNQTIAVYADDGITPLSVPGATFSTATLTIK